MQIVFAPSEQHCDNQTIRLLWRSYLHGDQVDMVLLANQVAVLIKGWRIAPGIPDHGTLVA